jgi:hypothetical protein
VGNWRRQEEKNGRASALSFVTAMAGDEAWKEKGEVARNVRRRDRERCSVVWPGTRAGWGL